MDVGGLTLAGRSGGTEAGHVLLRKVIGGFDCAAAVLRDESFFDERR